MSGAILGVIDMINASVQSVANNGGLLNMSLSDFSSSIYIFISWVSRRICMPAAYTILALFFLLELQKISTKVEGVGGGTQLGAELVFRLLIKLALCKLAVDMAGLICNAMVDVSGSIVTQIANLAGGEAAWEGIPRGEMEIALNAKSFWDQLVILLLSFLTYLVVAVSTLLAQLIVIVRFFQLYTLFAVAPIPLATLPHTEMSQIGKGFLKSFAAACVQGIVLMVVLGMFPMLLKGAFLDNLDGGDINGALLSVVGYAVVLAVSVIGSSATAKKITAAM